VILNAIFGGLATLSFILLVWQWLAARRFPLHRRSAEQQLGTKDPNGPSGCPAFQPAVTLLKSLKGADAATEDCLRSWFAQNYPSELQILFGVVSAEDPVCAIVKKLTQEFPQRDVVLEVIPTLIGTNAKISKLAELEKLAKHDILVVSDADVRVPALA
jgi:cellulose synthase/poly-beta-1,6-N-acetylglucosamine synthase-like glycosyltransferase